MKILVIALFGLLSLGQTVNPITYHIHSHGGVELKVNAGLNTGDEIRIDVRCNNPEYDECFLEAPRLSPGPQLTRILNESGHQIYEGRAMMSGEQWISAAYWRYGLDIDYDVHIVTTERLP